MKAMIVALSCLLAFSGALAADSCYNDVEHDCSASSNSFGGPALYSCNSKYGAYHGPDQSIVAIEMQAYAKLHLERSFDYLLSASYFNNYQTNRAGFSKLFKKLSDETWEKTIDIIKHVTQRGIAVDLDRTSTQKPSENKTYTVELFELQALAKALDTQKEIAERAFYIHKEATKNSQHLHDPEVAQYLEEEFIEGHAKQIRELAGHATDLKKFVADNRGQDLSLGLYLFDEYLQKVV